MKRSDERSADSAASERNSILNCVLTQFKAVTRSRSINSIITETSKRSMTTLRAPSSAGRKCEVQRPNPKGAGTAPRNTSSEPIAAASAAISEKPTQRSSVCVTSLGRPVVPEVEFSIETADVTKHGLVAGNCFSSTGNEVSSPFALTRSKLTSARSSAKTTSSPGCSARRLATSSAVSTPRSVRVVTSTEASERAIR